MLASCRGFSHDSAMPRRIDTLCNVMSGLRYADVAFMDSCAGELLRLAVHDNELSSLALNARAQAAFMRMDYRTARSLYDSVISTSQCEIERLAADVGIMQICYRTSANREFFDYRTRALRRIKRINEDTAVLSQKENIRFSETKVELAALSVCYFSNLGLTDELSRSLRYLDSHLSQTLGRPCRLYGWMIRNYSAYVPMEKRAEALCLLHERAESEGQAWIAANCKLLLAVMLRDDAARTSLHAAVPAVATFAGRHNVPIDDLPFLLAKEAVAEFQAYGDKYMMIEALAVAASCSTYRNRFEESIGLLEEAVALINSYYSEYYPYSSLPALELFEPDDAAELAYMENESVYNIHECLISVRREASCAYAGIGEKPSSDMNRNCYLDLLRATRMNKQMESRIETAEANAAELYGWALFSVVMLVALFAVSFILNMRWCKHRRIYSAAFNRVLAVCRNIALALPVDASCEQDIYDSLTSTLDKELGDFSGRCRFSFRQAGGGNSSTEETACEFPLHDVDGDARVILRVVSEQSMTAEKRVLLEISLPYISAAINEGRRIVAIGCKHEELEQKLLSCKLYLAEHKRENVMKRVSLSLVNSMRPYMNRMLKELQRLSGGGNKGADEERSLEYLSELAAMLDEYNAIPEQWIKMNRGELSLHIENFALDELFSIISKSAESFAMKGLELHVAASDAVVKADRALTLFMINTLVENASKFTPTGGSVHVEAVEGGDFVEVAVRDTGVGMSPEDVDKIRNSKVYDASSIGADDSLASRKGHGFGLMNCKGIIEKYRKTDALFSVCRMDITSNRGSGSRFSFRLPKGVIRSILILLAMLPATVCADNGILSRVDALADSVYMCNVDGRHAAAIDHAGEAIRLLNEFYRETIGGSDTLSLASGAAVETGWWRRSLFPYTLVEHVFYNLLDIRNEAAVASLALRDWQCYRYNNNIYAQLYRLVHEDRELAGHYENMRRLANYRQAAAVLCFTLLAAMLLVGLILYMRRVVMERVNIRILLDMNRRLLKLAAGDNRSAHDLVAGMAREIYDGMGEYLRMERVALILKEGTGYATAFAPSVDADERTGVYLQTLLETGGTYAGRDGLARAVPLVVRSQGDTVTEGIMEILTTRPLTDSEAATVELVAGYAAAALYHSTVNIAGKYRSLEELEEEVERTSYEENRMHVKNMVMDNCLSMIKHETLYYPSRIRTLVDGLHGMNTDSEEWHCKSAAIRELMDCYTGLYDILTDCASRQIDDTGLRLTETPLRDFLPRLRRFVARKAAKNGVEIELECSRPDTLITGDVELTELLFEALLGGLAAIPQSGKISLQATDEGAVVRVEITDERRHATPDELDLLFVPSPANVASGNMLHGMEFLVAKEIVRMHEDFTGRYGCRMEAHDGEAGTVIVFTLPKKQNAGNLQTTNNR